MSEPQINTSLSRANFSAPRGMRYGQDSYDDRSVQATRLVSYPPTAPRPSTAPPSTSIVTCTITCTSASTAEPQPQPETTAETRPAKPPANPLRMFGLLAPPPLRTAQTAAIALLETTVAQLVNVDREMQAAEIEIRRARKWALRGGVAGKRRARKEGEDANVDASVNREKASGVGNGGGIGNGIVA